MIEQYRQPDGWYKYDGLDFQDEENLLGHIMGFCGCGQPQTVLLYVADALQLVDDLKEKVWTDQETYESWDKRVNDLFKTEAATYLMWYTLDRCDLTEHGGSVPGWLTDKGKGVLADIRKYIKEEKDAQT